MQSAPAPCRARSGGPSAAGKEDRTGAPFGQFSLRISVPIGTPTLLLFPEQLHAGRSRHRFFAKGGGTSEVKKAGLRG